MLLLLNCKINEIEMFIVPGEGQLRYNSEIRLK